MRYFSYLLMFTLLTGIMYAQSSKQQNESASQKDTNTTNVKIVYYPRTISWWDCGNGFVNKSADDKVTYMTRFDKQGNYIETLVQKEWNDSSSLHPFFNKSNYKLHRVTAYWEVSDANKKGYYLELMDSKSQISGVWADELGNFSTIPTVNNSKK